MAFLDRVPGWVVIGLGLVLGLALALAFDNMFIGLIPVVAGGILSGIQAGRKQGPPPGGSKR